MIEYKSYDYTRTIPVDDYILRYRDERRFMAYCRECVGMETVGVVRLLMIRRTIYPVFGIY